MAEPRSDATTPESPPEMEWDELAPGGEISATVMMASGFVLQEGQRVRERYHIENVLGEGAMGQVLAVTLVGSSDKQTYALKVVARPVSDEESADSAEHAEAERHAKWFATLLRAEAAKQDVVQRHGVSVARLFALVQLDDGSIGMRMELARGRSLESQVEEERANRGEPAEVMWSVGVVRKLMSQLRRLHELVESGSPFGFVHSDIKPGNVFVDDSDPSDVHVTLLDFGVATAGQALVADMTMRHTSRKTFVLQQTGGTIGYAPPYHFSGKATPLSDVYASIVILYELLTAEFPWRFGEIAIDPDNIMQLEAAMLRGPRPVREVRPSIAVEEARVLDEFFVREFKALHELAETVSRQIGDGKSDPPKPLVEQLQKLARDYQSKLDTLRNRLSPSRRPAAPDLSAGAMPVIPKAPPAPKFEGFDAGSGSAAAGPASDVTPALLTRKKPKLIVMASVAPPAMSGADAPRPPSIERKRARPASTESNARSAVRERPAATRPRTPPATRMAATLTMLSSKVRSVLAGWRKWPWLWITAGLAVPVVAAIVYAVARSVGSSGNSSPAPVHTITHATVIPSEPAAPATPPPPIPAPPVVVAPPPPAPTPAVVAPVAPAAPADPTAPAAPSAAAPATPVAPATGSPAPPSEPEGSVAWNDVANAPLVHAPAESGDHHHHPHHESASAGGSGALPCTCVSSDSGARVVAHGGALAHEVVLCTASDAAGHGRGEFVGSGVIPAPVFAAQPELSCRAGETTLRLVVQRYATSAGPGSLFRCREATAPAVHDEPASPAPSASHAPSSGGATAP